MILAVENRRLIACGVRIKKVEKWVVSKDSKGIQEFIDQRFEKAPKLLVREA
jgi:hypothetical protein